MTQEKMICLGIGKMIPPIFAQIYESGLVDQIKIIIIDEVSDMNEGYACFDYPYYRDSYYDMAELLRMFEQNINWFKPKGSQPDFDKPDRIVFCQPRREGKNFMLQQILAVRKGNR